MQCQTEGCYKERVYAYPEGHPHNFQGVYRSCCQEHTPKRFRIPKYLIKNSATTRRIVSTGTGDTRRIDIENALTRKPASWKEVERIDWSEADNMRGMTEDQLISKLPMKVSYDIMSNPDDLGRAKFKNADNLPQIFIMKHAGRVFIVDREGHDYARYIGEI